MGMRRRKEAGFNLVELLIAIAVLGIILLAVLALFSMGQRNVYAGRQASKAITLGTQVLEDLAPLNRQMIWQGAFNVTGTSSGNSFSLPRASGLEPMSFTNSVIRTTNTTLPIPAQSDAATQNTPPGLLTKWTQRAANAGLADASISVILTPAMTTSGVPLTFSSAQLLRIRVLVRWNEGNRVREAVWDTVKAY
jgi:prepilin-type N-terminal cleavage/methylation domain-containing protein